MQQLPASAHVVRSESELGNTGRDFTTHDLAAADFVSRLTLAARYRRAFPER